jgi:hypothetical protein
MYRCQPVLVVVAQAGQVLISVTLIQLEPGAPSDDVGAVTSVDAQAPSLGCGERVNRLHHYSECIDLCVPDPPVQVQPVPSCQKDELVEVEEAGCIDLGHVVHRQQQAVQAGLDTKEQPPAPTSHGPIIPYLM